MMPFNDDSSTIWEIEALTNKKSNHHKLETIFRDQIG